MTTLRPYQSVLVADVRGAWAAGARNVVMLLPTGGGKTVCFSELIREHQGASCLIAHRAELVSQASLALARQAVPHNLIAAETTRRAIIREHIDVLGRTYYDPGARCAVAGVHTLVQARNLERWAAQVTLWICDEGHHLTAGGGLWHRAIDLFTHSAVRGLMPTATPSRADGKGLGREPIGDGVADVLVAGPPMRWLIDQGYLSDYRIVCSASDMQVIADVGASGDWSSAQLREAARRSHIVGDVVQTYKRWATGRLGLTFSTDIETAVEITRAYNQAGVRAETLTGKTDPVFRRQILRRFAARELDQLVAVDIISEGFDLPAVEVVSLARPTASLGLYLQQVGRALRPMAGKTEALIIDHVGNVLRHRAPDLPREWTLARRGSRSQTETAMPLRSCLGCYRPFERYRTACPYCGASIPEPSARGAPDQVDGDLVMLDPEALDALRGGVERLDMAAGEYGLWLVSRGCPPIGVAANTRRHVEAQDAQATLREAMARWGGEPHAKGLSDREIQRLFYLTYGVDVLGAQALGASDAQALTERIQIC